MPARQDPIVSPGLLLCEGADDFAFFLSLLQSLGVPQEVVRIEVLEGRYQLHNFLNGLPIRDREQVLAACGIVCDSDTDDGLAAFGRIRDDLRATGYAAPDRPGAFVRGPWGGVGTLSVGVYLMPDNQATGALQDLCLATLATDPSMSCVDAYLDCVSAAVGINWRPQDRSKARLNAWLASRANPTLRLGQAMNAGVIDRASPAFDQVRRFLADLAAAATPGASPAS